MARPRSLERSLVLNLAFGVVLLGAAMLAITLWTRAVFVERAVSRVMQDVEKEAEYALANIDDKILGFGRISESWLRDRWSGKWSEEQFDSIFVPLLSAAPFISSVLIGSPSGELYVLTRTADEWRSSLVRPSQWGNRARTRRWSDSKPTPSTGWADSSHSVYAAPWLTFALGLQEITKRDAPHEARVYIGDPREVVATGEAGRILSLALMRNDGQTVVLAFQSRIEIATEMVRALRRLEDGRDAMLYGNPNRKASLVFLGVPNHPRAPTMEAARRYMLRPPAELGGPISDLLEHLFAVEEYTLGSPTRFDSDGETWWGMAQELFPVSGITPTSSQPQWLLVARSEADLLADIPNVIPWIVGVAVVIVALAIWQAVRLAARIGEPIEQLVDKSRRMQRLSFEQEAKLETDIVELGILARAMDVMREALLSYTSVSEEERIAEAIMRSILPVSFPRPAGYQIAALHRPATEPGGTVFDVSTLTQADYSQRRRKTTRKQGNVAFLMLDPWATGLEAAMLSSQMRAAFRAGSRAGVALEQIARAMDLFLCQDLRDAGSVRAWFGQLNADRATLSCLAASFETVLHYRAAQGRFAPVGKAGSALGRGETASALAAATIELAPGDLVVIASLGVVDALSVTRERFGSARIEAIIAEHATAPADEIVARLETALGAFCEGEHEVSDQAILLIKREA